MLSQTNAAIFLITLLGICSCTQKKTPPQAPPPEVSVIKVMTAPVTVFEEYAAQTEAVSTVEIRSRVGGFLERQAFTDGAQVKQGDLLFIIDQQPYITALAQVKATIGQAEASYLNSKQNLARLRPLLADQAISQQDVDAAIAKESVDKAAVEVTKAQVKQAELNLGYTTIRAPQKGIVSKTLINPGGLVTAGTTLLTTLYSLDPIYVNLTIGEQKLLQLQKQLSGNTQKHEKLLFKLKLIDGSDYPHEGKLNFIDAAVDSRNGTLPVRISVPNPEHLLRPGQFVRATMPASENPKAILIPQKAVQELQGKQSVFVIGPDNKAIYRNIVAKVRVGNNWLVESGLNPDETIVVEGIGKVKPDMRVKPVMLAENAGNADKKTPAAAAPKTTAAGR
ncbi:MAG: efflux RND transporter periplasmic adaptor subunit [Pseudomonadota bacterium]